MAELSLGLFAVADGMGGYEGGEVASQLALRELRCGVATAGCRVAADEVLREAFARSQAAVVAARRGPLCEMGCTLSALWVRHGRAAMAHVGDSRIYRLRAGVLEALTRDHSVAQELRDQGVELAEDSGLGHILSRALGTAHGTPDVHELTPAAGDVFLLCTDGLHGALEDSLIARVLAQRPPELAAKELVALAYEAGSQDNITAVVVRA